MKFNLLSLGLLSFSMLTLAPSLTSFASATCVTTDVSNQVSIHGSKEPSQQTNNTAGTVFFWRVFGFFYILGVYLKQFPIMITPISQFFKQFLIMGLF